MERPNVTDYVTVWDKAQYDILLDAIEDADDERLSLSGGQMLGTISWASGQTFFSSGTFIPDPIYAHSGVYNTLDDHINDGLVHKSSDELVHLQNTTSYYQDGDVFISGTIKSTEDIYADRFFGNGINITGLPAASDSDPSDIAGNPGPGISTDYSRSDHRHRGQRSSIAGDYISLSSSETLGTSYLGDVTISLDISGTLSGNALFYITPSGQMTYIDGPPPPGFGNKAALRYYSGTFHWDII